jgi:RNA polymerase sigma-70 factor (ECF subfamily)
VLENTPEADFSQELVMIALMKKIYKEVDKLPPRMRDVFYLSYKEGLKPARIAEMLDVSVQTVKNQRSNAIKLLRISLKDNPLLMVVLTYMTCR